MRASLSVRIAEQPRNKARIGVAFEDLAAMAAAAGFRGMSLRASVVSVTSPALEVRRVREVLDSNGLAASMVTGDLALATNGPTAPACLRAIEPHLDLAEGLGAGLVRVMLHDPGQVVEAAMAARSAAARGLRLAQQCHWGSLCETPEQALAVFAAVGGEGFGITYEPANLLACGGEHGAGAIDLLRDTIANVYFQNLRLDDSSTVRFATRARGSVGVRFVPLEDPAGIDARALVSALRNVDYDGWFTVHQPLLEGQDVAAAVVAAGAFVKGLGIA